MVSPDRCHHFGHISSPRLSLEINLAGFRYNWLGTLFYIAYICSQWLLMGWKHFKPHIYCAVVVFFWGVIASVQASITSWGGLMACRFFLVRLSPRKVVARVANNFQSRVWQKLLTDLECLCILPTSTHARRSASVMASLSQLLRSQTHTVVPSRTASVRLEGLWRRGGSSS